MTRALATRSEGYWAGTTTADREAVTTAGGSMLQLADARQQQLAHAAAAAAAEVRAADQAIALHPVNEGSLRWYRRRGCRCSECRAANTANRAAERARASSRAQEAA